MMLTWMVVLWIMTSTRSPHRQVSCVEISLFFFALSSSFFAISLAVNVRFELFISGAPVLLSDI